MRKVKLMDLGTYVEKSEAYQAPNKRYYSSEEAYLKTKNKKENYNICYSLLKSYMGYKDGEYLPKLASVHIYNYAKHHGWDALIAVLKDKKSAIEWALETKDFTSETNKINYIFAIVNNHIRNYKPKAKLIEKPSVSVDVAEDVELNNTAQKVTDLSSFLEDDDE